MLVNLLPCSPDAPERLTKKNKTGKNTTDRLQKKHPIFEARQ